MPHIENSDKEMYNYVLMKMSDALSGAPVGHVVYVLYVLALRWMKSGLGTCNFERRLIALGTLNEAQHELRRLHLADYEDQKIRDNGEAQ
jgi:hypothetical protein